MKVYIIICAIIWGIPLNLFAQQKDSTEIYQSEKLSVDSIPKPEKQISLLKKSVLPVSLILVGSAISGSPFEKNIKYKIRDNIIDDFALPIDDLMQYVPIAEIYIADIVGVKAKNHWFDQTKYLIISNVITSSLTQAGKRIINKQRPNGSDYSFPSGHTSFSFTNSAVLFEEFRDSSTGLAYSGYFLTSTVGALRVINNKHWLSDVLVGAGLGILVTKLVYHYEPLKNWNPFEKTKNLTFIPKVNGSNYGFKLIYKL
ncbi:phosphatase PAP2 family protein [Chondrinema litorale]|uniref:phosphatase PAP2 family protein n=1 Tax=Chondrinema litorale TaxID=2994555 RepID=UPI00254271C7|nr:phosphatase PAP2 family protein [Chondrinema litorale]UZR96427.1 phosphatase PAP2 family protein [Chondrinema litorale]